MAESCYWTRSLPFKLHTTSPRQDRRARTDSMQSTTGVLRGLTRPRGCSHQTERAPSSQTAWAACCTNRNLHPDAAAAARLAILAVLPAATTTLHSMSWRLSWQATPEPQLCVRPLCYSCVPCLVSCTHSTQGFSEVGEVGGDGLIVKNISSTQELQHRLWVKM